LEETNSAPFTNEELQIGIGIISYTSFLNNIIMHSKHQSIEISSRSMRIIIETYQIKDKRMLFPAAALIFKPRGIQTFIKD